MKVSVLVIAYNHERFIAECLRSIQSQVTDFDFEIVFADDCSTDKTKEIALALGVKSLPRTKNLGITSNLLDAYSKCKGQYVAILEGDDYWTDPNKLQMQADLMDAHPQVSLCHTSCEVLDEISGTRYDRLETCEPFIGVERFFEGPHPVATCTVMARRNVVKWPEWFKKLKATDFPFCVLHAQVGPVAYIDVKTAVYRRHAKGYWTGKSHDEKRKDVMEVLHILDEHFQGAHHASIMCMVFANGGAAFPSKARPLRKLAIIDDLFPWPVSGFRMAEMEGHLENFDGARVFSTDGQMNGLEPLATRLKAYKGAKNVSLYDPKELKGSLGYTIFLYQAARRVEEFEQYGIPFVFTLYPGGQFMLDDELSDAKLRRVCVSPMLRSVIVTQRTTKNYLIRKGFVDPSKIEYIYGGVCEDKTLVPSVKRLRFGEDKDTFDLCFVAQKYMKGGIDKGYDVFTQAVNLLQSRHKFVRAHIVGPWTLADSPIKIDAKFYGLRPGEFFPGFYANMDAIISPNSPNLPGHGKFDGFPNGCSVGAALCGTAVFASDPLGDNEQFENGKHMEFISRDMDALLAKLERYIECPSKLYDMGSAGERKFRETFGRMAQLVPRFKILERHLAE